MNRTLSEEIGMRSGDRSVFANLARVTSTSRYRYIPNSGSLVLLLEQMGCQVNIVGEDLLNAEGRQSGFSI